MLAKMLRPLGYTAVLIASACVSQPPNPEIEPAEAEVQLPNTPEPSAGDVVRKIGIEEGIPYVDDATYVAQPDLLLGKVAAIRKDSSGCSTNTPAGHIAFEEKIAGLKFSPATTPVLQASVVINRQVSASVQALSYLSAELDASSLFKLIVTDERHQRVDDNDATYREKRDHFLANNTLTKDPGVCWLLQVDGYTHKSIARTKYTKVDGKVAGGAFGVKVNGTYYSSDESYQLDHRFGLSFSVLQRPPGLLAKTDSLTSLEKQMLSGLSSIPDKSR